MKWRRPPPPASLLSTEILGAFISVVSIWIVTGALVYLAIERIVRNDYEINGHVMLITSGCAVLVNIVWVPQKLMSINDFKREHQNLILHRLLSESTHGSSVCLQDGLHPAPLHHLPRSRLRLPPHRRGRPQSRVPRPRPQPHAPRGPQQHQRPRRLHPRGGRPAAERGRHGGSDHHLLSGQIIDHIPVRVRQTCQMWSSPSAETVTSVGYWANMIFERVESLTLSRVVFIMDDRVQYSCLHARCSPSLSAPSMVWPDDGGETPSDVLLRLFQPEYKVADPICTFLFSVFVLCTTVTILRDVFRILMEGTGDKDFKNLNTNIVYTTC